MSTSENLKQARQKSSFTQEEIAQKLNVSRKTVSSWETGRHSPDIDTLGELSDLYKIPINDLIKGSSSIPESGGFKRFELSINKIFYYLNIILLILSVINLVIPAGMHQVWVTPLLILNLCCYVFTYKKWKTKLTNKTDIIKIIIVFVALFLMAVIFGLANIEDSVGTQWLIPNAVAVLFTAFTLTASFIVALDFW